MNGRPYYGPPDGQPPFPMPPGMMPPRPGMMPMGGMPPMGAPPGYPPMGMPFMPPMPPQMQGMPPPPQMQQGGQLPMPPGPPPGRPPFMPPGGHPQGMPHGGMMPMPPGPRMSLPPPPQLPPVPPRPADDPANWSEHTTNDGRKYWHNKVTKVSTYEKPACLAAPPAAAPAPAAPQLPTPPEQPKWKEYKTPEGKVYFSDGKTSLWEEPEDLKTYKVKLAEYEAKKKAFEAGVSAEGAGSPAVEVVERPKPKPAAIEVNSDSDDDTSKVEKSTKSDAKSTGSMPVIKQEIEESRSLDPSNPEDAMTIFKNMLSSYSITSTMKWAEAQKTCSKDRRWNVLKTTGEKKQAFAEFQTRRLKEEKEEKRTKVRKAREAFLKMLAECAEIDAKTRWHKVDDMLKEDPRYDNPELDTRDKEEMFNDFVTELAKKEKEERRNNMKMFGELLRKLAEHINHKTTWKEVEALINGSDVELSPEDQHVRDVVEDVDKRHAFEDYVAELEKAYLEKKRQERDERRRIEKANEDAFREFLKQMAKESEINMDSRWREFKPRIEMNELYTALDGQGGKTAVEIFEGVVDELRDVFRADKSRLRNLIPRGPSIKHDTEYEAWEAGMLKALGDEGGSEKEGEERENRRLKEFKDIVEARPGNVKHLFKEIRDKAIAAHREEQRIREKRVERYKDLLIEFYYRSDHVGIPWKDAQDELKKHSAYSALDPEDRQKLFDAHMAYLQAQRDKLKAKKAKSSGGSVTGNEDASTMSAEDTLGGDTKEGGEEGSDGKENVAQKTDSPDKPNKDKDKAKDKSDKKDDKGKDKGDKKDDEDDASDSDSDSDDERSKKKKKDKKHKKDRHKEKKHKKRKRKDRSRSEERDGRRHHNGKKRSRSRASSSDSDDKSRSRERGKKRRGRSDSRVD